MKLKIFFILAIVAVAGLSFTACDSTEAEGYQSLMWVPANAMYDRFPGTEIEIPVPAGGIQSRYICQNQRSIWFGAADPADEFASKSISAEGFYSATIYNLLFDIEFEPNTTGEERQVKIVTKGAGGSFTFTFTQAAQ